MSENDQDGGQLPVRWGVILSTSVSAAGACGVASAVGTIAVTGDYLAGAAAGVVAATGTFFGVMTKMNQALARQ
ncbi:hypothetical protein OG592_43935 (plasmid) [Streptomyces avidinii]|uniref:hypothetical protein n=1 Tax=Streptomyces avidinii TaxID=1895 RepID=UPI003862E864|nr:hypothetical protein OG592_43935 [Streptomyces avidinii]